MNPKNTIILLFCCLLALNLPAQPLPLNQPVAAPAAGWFTDNGQTLKAEHLPAKQAVRWPGAATESRLLARPEQPLKATHLTFTHTLQPGPALFDWMAATGLAHRKIALPPGPPTVLQYEVLYADSSTLSIPARFGEGIHRWYRVHAVGPMLWASAGQVTDLNPESGEKAAVYRMKWPNPYPEKAILQISLKSRQPDEKNYGDALVSGIEATNEPATGKTWYVDRPPMGNDGQPGTFEKPFGSLRHAASIARPGDVVYVRGGYYMLNRPVNLEFEGETGKWLTLSAYFGETPVLDALGLHHDYRDDEARQQAGDMTPRRQHDTGIISAWGNPSYLRIQGLHIRNSRRAGISVYGQSAEGSKSFGETRQVEVNFNTTYKTRTMGIIIHVVDSVKVIGNRVARPHSVQMGNDPLTGEQIAFDHGAQEGIDLSRNRVFEIAYNEVYGGGKEAIDCISVQDGEIHHNYVHSSLNGIYIDSWSVPIRRLNIHHNFIHNAFNGIPLATEGSNDLFYFDIHHNIILHSKSTGIGVNEATYKAKPAKVQQIRVYHNTIDGSGGHASAIGWQASGIDVGGFVDNPDFRDIEVRDNIVTHTTGRPIGNVYASKPEQNISISHNLIHPAEDRTPDWMVGDNKRAVNNYFDQGRQAVRKEPKYRDPERGDFRLCEGSPAIGAGSQGGHIGALSPEAAWQPGLDWSGKVTAFYHGETIWQPLHIPPEKFTMHRNHLQRPSWFQRNRYGADFQNLPNGQQRFAGATFHLPDDEGSVHPTVLTLRGKQAEVEATAIRDIPVNQKANKLAFLHAYHLENKEIEKGTTLFHYQIHYADGSSETVPVQWQVHVEDWLAQPDQLHDLPEARLGWNMLVQQKRGRTQQLRLYVMQWENPHPEKEIKNIDLLNNRKYMDGAPAVFGISLGE